MLTVHSEKTKAISAYGMFLGIIKNPPIIATAFGIIVSLAGIRIPIFMEETTMHLAAITTPIALMCLGGNMAFSGYNPKFKFALVSSLVKVIAVPLAATFAAYLFGFRGDDLTIIMIKNGVPAAVVGYVMLVELGGDVYTASTNVVLTTLLSSFTLTFFIFGFRMLGIII